MYDRPKNIKRLALVKPRYIVFISVIIILLMITTAYYELSENKREVYHLLDEYANSVIHTIDKSSANTVISDMEIENLLTQHLLGVARGVARIDSISTLSDNLLTEIAQENDVFRINVFDGKGVKIMSNSGADPIHKKSKGKYSPSEYITPILEGKEKEIVMGLKEARVEKGKRYAVAVARPSNRKGAIVVNLDAESFVEFMKKIGFGKMILDIGDGSGIEYIILQNEKEIIAANKNVDELTPFGEDEFLKSAFKDTIPATRITGFGGRKVYEIVKTFTVENEKYGIFRVGLSMNEIYSVENRMILRAVIVSIVVVIISVIVIASVISNQNYRIVSDEYKKIQTFTGEILENLSHGIITIDENGIIKIFNLSAAKIFGIAQTEVIGKKIDDIGGGNLGKILGIYTEKKEIKNSEILIINESAGNKILLVNTAVIYTENKTIDAFTLVIEDITESKSLTAQLAQNEKLVAMGELASGVAHEIRNPLNSINMISQRLGKEYSEKVSSEEFDTLTNILRKESERVNGIIEQFLRFARPPKLMISDVSSDEFMNEICAIAGVHAASKQIIVETEKEKNTVLKIDNYQMKQVFLNLIQNAVEAMKQGGVLKLTYRHRNNKNIFCVSDTGSGISKETLNKIFDIYFTTKSTGTGMGLSIVRQIILQHNGTIEAESEPGRGAKFIITIP
jgi:PAS domain S-box-containing protein